MHKGTVVLTVLIFGIALVTGWFAQGARAEQSAIYILHAPIITNLNPIPPANLRALLVSDRDGNDELYLASATSTNALRLTTNLVDDTNPRLSPDRRTILYQSGNSASDSSLYLINADGTNPRQLIGLPGAEVAYHWSPDSSKVLFHAGPITDTTLYVMPISGGIPVVVAGNVTPTSRWSPDGSRIAYSTNATDDYEVWTVNPDGTGALQLTNNVSDDYFADWLLGGTEMLVNTFNGNDYDIYRYLSDGTGFKGVIVNAASTVAADVSPNEHYWVYTDEDFNVGIVDAYSGERILVANECQAEPCTLRNFTWLPQSNEEVAYTLSQAGRSTIYRVRFFDATSEAERLIEDADAFYWSPNPRYGLYIRTTPAPAGQPEYVYPVVRNLETMAEVNLGTETTRTTFHGWTFGTGTSED
jgi:dipeptidyl aminopeptidase/acylaminoacyl peptidase